MIASVPAGTPAALPGPFATRPLADELRPSPATIELVKSQVQALLLSSPSFHELTAVERANLEDKLVHISAYAAECVRDLCWQSQRLGQTPVLRRRESTAPPVARAQETGFAPRAAGQAARLTQEQLRAIAFPTFVADLIRGTFDAVVRTSIQQMESFIQMINNASGTVDQFMQNNISDNQARDWLAQMYPEHIHIQEGRAAPREGADERPAPDFSRDLHVDGQVSLDEGTIEDVLVPAARRRLAENRLQILSTMILMGVNRIVVTGGKIRATMGFHIDTTDRAREENATDFDFRHSGSFSFGYGPFAASASHSIAYVRSTRASSDAEINMETDLTGEVELHFKSDYFPAQRFASMGTLGTIRNNTAAPEANTPADMPANPLGGTPSAGGVVERYVSPRTRRSPPPAPSLRPIGAPLPEVRPPVEPTAPRVARWTPAPGWEGVEAPSGAVVSPAPGTRGTTPATSPPASETPATSDAPAASPAPAENPPENEEPVEVPAGSDEGS